MFPEFEFGVDGKEPELVFVRPSSILDAVEAIQHHPILHRHVKGIFPVCGTRKSACGVSVYIAHWCARRRWRALAAG
jgi:hypothetical protein